MRRFVDLHTHSTASDGMADPAELVRLADEQGLAAVAITDHDTTAGLAEAQAAAENFPELQFIPGAEVSAQFPNGVLHILALDIDPQAPALTNLLEQLRQARRQRNPQIAERLRSLGMEITLADAEAIAGQAGVVGRLHFAMAMQQKGFVKTLGEAFGRFIGDGGPAFVDKERISPRDAIGAIRQAGGVAVLAHPKQLHCTNDAQLERILREFISHGLNGIEAYHSDHDIRQTRLYLDMAIKHNLTVTGGSDFHGSCKPNVTLGRPRVPLAALSGQLAEKITRQ